MNLLLSEFFCCWFFCWYVVVCCPSYANVLVIMETAKVSVHVNTGVTSQELGNGLFIGCWAGWNLTPPVFYSNNSKLNVHIRKPLTAVSKYVNSFFANVFFAVIQPSTAVRVVHICLKSMLLVTLYAYILLLRCVSFLKCFVLPLHKKVTTFYEPVRDKLQSFWLFPSHTMSQQLMLPIKYCSNWCLDLGDCDGSGRQICATRVTFCWPAQT